MSGMRKRGAIDSRSKKTGATTPRAPPGHSRAHVVALIDRKPLIRESIQRLLEATTDDLSVFTVANTAELFAARGERHLKFHLVILDIGSGSLSDAWARECLQALNRRLSDVPIVILSDNGDSTQMMDALTYGVRGYITTGLSSKVAVEALHLVCAGGTFVPISVLMDAAAGNSLSNARNHVLGARRALDRFTPRERQVLKVLQEGEPNKAIARRLNVQESTVKVHVRRIMRKLNAKNRTQAAILSSRALADETTSDTDLPKIPSTKP
jgi:DNA-binding NarL/FixJ family response regulator